MSLGRRRRIKRAPDLSVNGLSASGKQRVPRARCPLAPLVLLSEPSERPQIRATGHQPTPHVPQGIDMKKIEAIVRHYKLEDVKNALTEHGAAGMTITEVRGFGRQKGHTEMYRGTEYAVDFVPKVKVEVVVEDDQVQASIDAILKAAHTGQIGDGKVFVYNLETAVRIRTGETGGEAL